MEVPVYKSYHLVSQWSYSASCASGLVLGIHKIAQQETHPLPDRRIELFNFLHTLASAVEISLDFKLFYCPVVFSAFSNTAFFSSAMIRFTHEVEDESGVGIIWAIMDGCNALVCLSEGNNPLSSLLTSLSIGLNFGKTLWN